MTLPPPSAATMVRPGGSRIHPARTCASVLVESHVRVSPAVPTSFKISQIAGQSFAFASRITIGQALRSPHSASRDPSFGHSQISWRTSVAHSPDGGQTTPALWPIGLDPCSATWDDGRTSGFAARRLASISRVASLPAETGEQAGNGNSKLR